MSNTDIDKKIKEVYKIDVEAIRNLSSLANNLTKNGKLIIPGGLEIKGRLTVDGDTDLKKHANIGGMLRGNYNRLAGRDIFAFSVPGRGYLYFNEDRNLGVHATSGPLKVNNPTIGGNLLVEGTSTFNNKITSKNGGDFSGGRYFFTDEEKCGRLRVGCSWGVPGIYAEDGKHLILGSGGGQVQFQNNSSRIIGGAGHFNTVHTNGNANIGGNLRINGNADIGGSLRINANNKNIRDLLTINNPTGGYLYYNNDNHLGLVNEKKGFVVHAANLIHKNAPVHIRSERTGRTLQDDDNNARFYNHNRDRHETFYIEKKR